MYIMHTVEEIPAQGFPSGEVYNFSEIIDYAVVHKEEDN